MKTKTGIIMDIEKNKITLMTQSGEFVHVKRNKSILEIGSIFTGEVYTKLPFRKLIASAAAFIFFIFSSVEAYAYYTPVTTLIIDSSADIEIKINKWNKIISVNGLNYEGKEILEETQVKHASIDKGLHKILETTKRTLENTSNNENILLTIKDSNGYSNEETLKNKIDSVDLPINIEIVTSNDEENNNIKKDTNNKESDESKNNSKSHDYYADDLYDNDRNLNSELNKDDLDFTNKENDNIKNNTNNKKSDKSKNNSKSHDYYDDDLNNNDRNRNSKLNKEELDFSNKENDNIKNNTNNKKSDESKNTSKSHDNKNKKENDDQEFNDNEDD